MNVAYDARRAEALASRRSSSSPGLAINHYVNVNFHGFGEGVNALGCVYVDIDRRYFNDNSAGASYAVINVKPGLPEDVRPARRSSTCATATRTTTSCARARQQDFLRQVRTQVTARELLGEPRQADRHLRRQHALRHPVRAARCGGCCGSMLAVFSADQPIKRGQLPRAARAESTSTAQRRADQGGVAPVPLPAGLAKGPRGEPHDARRPRARASARQRASTARSDVDDAAGRRGPGAPGGQASASAFPVYYPTQLRARAPRSRRTAARLHDHAPRTTSATAPTRWSCFTGVDRRVLRPPGHVLAGPADPRQRRPRRARSAAASTSSTTTATGCGWSPGGRRRPSTGSRTRCSRRSPRRRCWRSPRSHVARC